MTNENTQETENLNSGKGNLPTHVVKVRHGNGKGATYEQIGVAWRNESGALYVKLYGTQVVSEGFTLYEIPEKEKAGE